MKKPAIAVGSLVFVGAFAAFFALEGRYMVEGGRAPWAVINEEPEMLKEAIAAGLSQDELNDTLRKAAGRPFFPGITMLLEAGASPNPAQKGSCMMAQSARWGRAMVTGLLLEGGADPALCDVEVSEIMSDVVGYSAGDVPQDVLVWTLSMLVDPAQPDQWKDALAKAEQEKLDLVVAYLQDPAATKVVKPATSDDRPKGKPGAVDKDDLKTVCTGASLADAAEYKKIEGQSSPLFYFERRHENFRWPGRGPGMPSLPLWWTDFAEPSNTQLVACVDAVEKEALEVCTYEGGGTVKRYSATYEFVLYEAKTGKKVASERVEMPDPPRCSAVKMGTKAEGLFPSYSKELTSFLAPHVGGPS